MPFVRSLGNLSYPLVDYPPNQISEKPSRRYWSILTKKERWGLSWRGWLGLALAAGLLASSLFVTVYPFLATNHRVDTKVLVVEGWIHDYAIQAAIDEYKSAATHEYLLRVGP